MATKATKLPSGNWRVRVQIDTGDGKQHYKSFTDPDRKQALLLAAQYECKGTIKPTIANATVSEAIESYIASRINVQSPRTITTYRTNQRCYYGSVNHIRVRDLTDLDAQNLINAIAVGHSPKTVRCAYSFFRSAIREYNRDFNPRVNLPAKVKREMQIPDEDKIVTLLQNTNGAIQNAILLASAYGMRRAEIAALTYQDIHGTTISVNKEMVKNERNEWLIKAPKSYAGTRKIVTTKEFVDKLISNRQPCSDRVCPMTPDVITRRYGKVRACAGITSRFHDLRHYAASVMLAIGVPDKYSMERLGQSSPDMLKRVYQHIISAKRDEVSDAVNGAVGDMLRKYDTKYDTSNEK